MTTRLAVALAAALMAAPAGADETAARFELGRRLFYDADLSINGTMSCATCHEQRHGFSDNNRGHPGALGDAPKRNVPGLANVGAFRHLTWADDAPGGLERQALTPIFGARPPEMASGGHEAEVLARFASDACYQRLFAAAFPEQGGRVGVDTLTAALASFERKLVSLDSLYDRGVLPETAEAGRKMFFASGCAECHKPPYFTDDAFHRVRAPAPDESDGGLADATGRAEDRGLFRTPPLRNVAVTFPYWHDGRARTLADAIALHETPAPPRETAEIVAFLESLTDANFLGDPRFSLPPASCPAAE